MPAQPPERNFLSALQTGIEKKKSAPAEYRPNKAADAPRCSESRSQKLSHGRILPGRYRQNNAELVVVFAGSVPDMHACLNPAQPLTIADR